MNDYAIIPSPIGNLRLEAQADFLTKVIFSTESATRFSNKGVIKETICQLNEYFLGNRQKFSLPMKPEGTKFQKKVWQKLTEIPYGETASYKEIAQKLGDPKKMRAVGGANNKNPIPIIIPCHRIIGADGSMVGYAGGIDKKIWLLELEKKNMNE